MPAEMVPEFFRVLDITPRPRSPLYPPGEEYNHPPSPRVPGNSGGSPALSCDCLTPCFVNGEATSYRAVLGPERVSLLVRGLLVFLIVEVIPILTVR